MTQRRGLTYLYNRAACEEGVDLLGVIWGCVDQAARVRNTHTLGFSLNSLVAISLALLLFNTLEGNQYSESINL